MLLAPKLIEDVLIFIESSREAFYVLEEQRQDGTMCFIRREPDPSLGQFL